ncbi:MAG: hypothetical protein OXP66_03270 [Candidatus Tectomicrobia bacterium]|nr:hypothetical protein [Candidatus Tectomicrobia bacterium]
MILTELRQRLDMANQWVTGNTPANDDTYWIRPTKTAISIACRAAWGEGIFVYASAVGHRDMGKWPQDPQRRPINLFVGVPEGNPNRAAHFGEGSLPPGQKRYDVACLRYEQSGPPKLLLAAELRLGSGPQVLQDFDNLRSSSAEFRVMVYNLDDAPIPDLINLIHYADTQAGGTYLFAAFADYGFIYEVYRDRRG